MTNAGVWSLDGIAPELPADGAFWIAPTASVIGRVRLERNASVWWGAVLRGDNDPIMIGPDSNVQDQAMLHTDEGAPLTLGRGVTVGHQATLHGCTVGDHSLIGIGAIILNGAVIGQGCVIGAGALVAEGKTIPDGSLVIGSPGRVVRELGPGALDGLKASAAHYVANWKRYKAGLVRL